MAAPGASEGQEKKDDVIALLEGFSDRLGAVEKDVLDPPGKNRRRKQADERGVSTATLVKEEIRALQDEHLQRRSRRARPRSRMSIFLQLTVVICVLALAYLYWHKISGPVLRLHWKGAATGDGEKASSWWQRVHGGELFTSSSTAGVAKSAAGDGSSAGKDQPGKDVQADAASKVAQEAASLEQPVAKGESSRKGSAGESRKNLREKVDDIPLDAEQELQRQEAEMAERDGSRDRRRALKRHLLMHGAR